MSTRSRIIAAQAVLVSVLIAVVFATLLRPESQQSLLGIDTPGGQAPGTGPTPGPLGEDDGGGDDDGGGGNDGPSATPGPSGGAGGPQVGATVAPETGLAPSLTPPDGAADDEGSPADDQYADTLAEITARLY